MRKHLSPCRSGGRQVVMPLTAIAVLSLALTGCHDSKPAQGPSPGPTTSASAVRSSPPRTGPRTYRATRDACAALDQQLLTANLGPDAGDFDTPRSEGTSYAVFARCQRQYGALRSRSLLSIDVMTVNQGTAQTYFEGLRRSQRTTETLTDIPGLGQGAYRYTDQQTGLHLVVYDANLYLRLSLIGQGAAGPDPATADNLLEQLARHAMDQLTR